ncbi:MAG: D-alanine--D-alanine ligase [Bacteroidetes bacterium]|nr:D-alanine--D-alanine ligase [Bacteroidota bacterium]
MNKINVAVVMGGYSTEFGISIQSGMVVCASLDRQIYNTFPIHITRENWFYLDPSGIQHSVNKADFSFNNGTHNIVPDVVFNTVHGTPGEDGYLASYFELLNIPQTSTGFYAAALSFNKRDCLTVLKDFGIACASSVYINQGMPIHEEAIIETVGLPCFVKPNRAGSSFGVSKVSELKDLRSAIELAFKEDPEILIETALVGTEVSIGVYRTGNELIALSPTEIVSENDFFDYEAKYEGKSQEITPARISEAATKAVKIEAKKIYHLLNMKGVTRSDFIIQDGVPFFIEINTTPGLSAESIIPKQALEAGMSLTEFFGILIEETLSSK